MLEKFMPYQKEISIIVARNSQGQIESFPVGENIHTKGILDTTIVPARISEKINIKGKENGRKNYQDH